MRAFATCERFADRVGRGLHRERERRPRIVDGAELAERDAAEIAEERAFIGGEEHVPILGIAEPSGNPHNLAQLRSARIPCYIDPRDFTNIDGMGTGSEWDHFSDTGGYAHLISAAAEYLLTLEGKRDWEMHHIK